MTQFYRHARPASRAVAVVDSSASADVAVNIPGDEERPALAEALRLRGLLDAIIVAHDEASRPPFPLDHLHAAIERARRAR